MANPLRDGRWLREPAGAVVDHEGVRFTTSPGTDLWQRTYYGFRNDNAPALLLPMADRTFTVRVGFDYRRRYDQAGVLVHIDSDHWAKASIEFEDADVSRLGSVVTTGGWSDWATRDIPSTRRMWYRVSQRGPDVLFESCADGVHWEQLRIFHLPSAQVLVGVYACSPEESSFEARFDRMRVEPSVWQAHA